MRVAEGIESPRNDLESEVFVSVEFRLEVFGEGRAGEFASAPSDRVTVLETGEHESVSGDVEAEHEVFASIRSNAATSEILREEVNIFAVEGDDRVSEKS